MATRGTRGDELSEITQGYTCVLWLVNHTLGVFSSSSFADIKKGLK